MYCLMFTILLVFCMWFLLSTLKESFQTMIVCIDFTCPTLINLTKQITLSLLGVRGWQFEPQLVVAGFRNNLKVFLSLSFSVLWFLLYFCPREINISWRICDTLRVWSLVQKWLWVKFIISFVFWNCCTYMPNVQTTFWWLGIA